MDGLNEVMPQAKALKFTKSVQYFDGAKTSRQVLEAGLDRFIPLIRHHKEMVSQMFDIKINIIMSDWQTFKEKLGENIPDFIVLGCGNTKSIKQD